MIRNCLDKKIIDKTVFEALKACFKKVKQRKEIS